MVKYNMYSDLGAQFVYSRNKNNTIEYELLPHNIDVTDLVRQYGTATNTEIVEEYSNYAFSSGPRGPQIDQVYFVYDNNDPENGRKYYILRNSPDKSYGAKGLFAIIKLDKKEKKPLSLSTPHMKYYLQQLLWLMIIVTCLIVMIFGENTLLQLSMIILIILGIVGTVKTSRKHKREKQSAMYFPFIKGTKIVGFRNINHIDTETVAKALDLGYEDRIAHIFNAPEKYLTNHLRELQKEIDIAYELKAAKINPSHYVHSYSPQQLQAMDDVKRSQE